MSILDLDEVMEHLNITRDDVDGELTLVMQAAEAAVSTRLGPLEPTTRTARVVGGTCQLLLPSAPALSLTSVSTTDGTELDVSEMSLDGAVGTVAYTTGGWFTAYAYDVVYEAGWEALPDDLMFALKELVRHLWSTQRGASSRPGSAVQESAGTPGYALPNRVLELLAPYETPRVA